MKEVSEAIVCKLLLVCFAIQLSVLDKYEHALAQVNDVALKRLADHEGVINILQVCEDPQVLAQQLCHVELVSEVVSVNI